jgi:ABC-2 type transport system ATP-binding protein
MNDTSNVIAIKSLSKRYRGTSEFSLSDITLQVQAGEVYGFLGANGAGKSTTIRTLLNFIQPTSGTATILGKDIVKDSVALKHDIGYLSGDVALYNKLTGREFLTYMNELHPAENPSYQQQLIEAFEVPASKRLSTLSKGNGQKVGIIQALMHEPRVLILDEPTSGLDPLMQEVFFEHINIAKSRGASIFFSSHNLAEVRRICDRIGFIHKGKLIREQSMTELAKTAAHTFDLVFAGEPPVGELRAIKSAQIALGHNKRSVIAVLPAESLADFFGVLAKNQLEHFDQREVNLEEEFMNYYREADREQV